MRTVPGFHPSTAGMGFANRWPDGFPVGVGPLTLGRVTAGMCGGMVWTAYDDFAAGRTPPPERDPPVAGPLARRLLRRQLASLGLPLGVLPYLTLMLPATPDPARRAATRQRAVPAVRAAVDAGKLQPLGLVRVVTADLRRLGDHHVVLAYGYEDRPGGGTDLAVYDPNHPGDDGVRLRVAPDGSVRHSRSGRAVPAVFPLRYRPPPGRPAVG